MMNSLPLRVSPVFPRPACGHSKQGEILEWLARGGAPKIRLSTSLFPPMKKKPAQHKSVPLKTARRPRAVRRLRYKIPFELYAHAQCWVLTQLRTRQRLSVPELARRANIPLSTLREYERFQHLKIASTPHDYAQALGYSPEEIARLSCRWLRRYVVRQQRLHGQNRRWRPRFPWEQ